MPPASAKASGLERKSTAAAMLRGRTHSNALGPTLHSMHTRQHTKRCPGLVQLDRRALEAAAPSPFTGEPDPLALRAPGASWLQNRDCVRWGPTPPIRFRGLTRKHELGTVSLPTCLDEFFDGPQLTDDEAEQSDQMGMHFFVIIHRMKRRVGDGRAYLDRDVVGGRHRQTSIPIHSSVSSDWTKPGAFGAKTNLALSSPDSSSR